MSTERRPTRSEVLKAAFELWNRPGTSMDEVALHVADLFGGPASDPVEIPRIESMPAPEEFHPEKHGLFAYFEGSLASV